MMGRSRSPFLRRAIIPLLLLMGFALTFMAYQPVHASSFPAHTAVVSYTTVANVGQVLTVSQPADLIVVTIQPYNLDAGATSMSVVSVSDTFGSVYSNVVNNAINSGAACSIGGGTCHDNELWAASSKSSGADTITITFSDASTSGNAEYIDVVGPSSAVAGTGTHQCSFASGCSTTMNTFIGPVPFSPGNDFAVGSMMTACQASSVVTPGTGFTLVSPASIFNGLAEYSGSSSVSPTLFPATCGVSTQWIDIGAVFIFGTVSTTTINTLCTGACSGGNNGTGNYLIRNQLHFYSSQNVNTISTIDNITIRLGTVKMNVTVGSLYIAVYFVNGVPSAGNPWAEIVGPTGQFTIPIFNVTSSNTFIHLNPQALICPGCYYAVGIMASPEGHSRGGGSANSGVQVLETSQVGVTEYSYAAAGPSATAKTPPLVFFSSTTFTPHHFIYIHTVFPIITTTSTTTVNGSVTATTTTTLTSTATTIDSTFLLNNANLPLIFFILLIPTGIFLGITKSLDGAFVGLLIGSVALVVVIPGLRFLFVGLIIALVAIAFIVRSR